MDKKEEELKNENIDISDNIIDKDDEIEINEDEDDDDPITKMSSRSILFTIGFCAWICAMFKYGIFNPLVIVTLIILILI